MRRLPFLNGVRAFEAAARGGGFAAAGRELGVTPAAVSRLVALLEQRLGTALFERRANRLAPTAAGAAYRDGLGRLFDDLARLTDEVRAMAAPRALVVGVGPTFAMRWLIPRLADFRRAAPDIELRLAAGGAARGSGPGFGAAALGPDWTCGIALVAPERDNVAPGARERDGVALERARVASDAAKTSPAGPDSLPAETLFAADLLPVAAPAVARRLRRPADLERGQMLRVAHAPEDWPLWFAGAGAAPRIARGPVFENYGQALQAASDGLGVAMGIRPYVDDDLRAGRLVAPFAQSVPKGREWRLVRRAAADSDPGFAAFRAWLLDAARAPAAAPAKTKGQSKAIRGSQRAMSGQ